MHGHRHVVDEHQVGGVAFAQEAAVFHIEQQRGRSARTSARPVRWSACLRAPAPARRPGRIAPAAGRRAPAV
jgi:hypothetical protein